MPWVGHFWLVDWVIPGNLGGSFKVTAGKCPVTGTGKLKVYRFRFEYRVDFLGIHISKMYVLCRFYR